MLNDDVAPNDDVPNLSVRVAFLSLSLCLFVGQFSRFSFEHVLYKKCARVVVWSGRIWGGITIVVYLECAIHVYASILQHFRMWVSSTMFLEYKESDDNCFGIHHIYIYIYIRSYVVLKQSFNVFIIILKYLLSYCYNCKLFKK